MADEILLPAEPVIDRTAPKELAEHGLGLWTAVVNSQIPLTPVNVATLTLMCRWLDKIYDWIDKDNLIQAGIATDKFMNLAKKFGLTPADLKNANIPQPRKPAAPKRKRRIDELKAPQTEIID